MSGRFGPPSSMVVRVCGPQGGGLFEGAARLHRALTAFVDEDIETAKAIPVEDDEVDALFNQVYRELMTFIMQDAKTIERANWLLWVAHNLERIGDRATNLCERAIFISTGQLGDLNV